MIKSYLKKIFSDLHSAIIGKIVSALLVGAGGIYLFSKKAWIWLKAILMLPAPLWVTIFFVLVVILAFIYLKKKKPVQYPTDQFKKKFGVLFDDKDNMRCNFCMTLLKPSSGDDPSRFFCSNPQCDSKHILKDNNGKKLTFQEALFRFKLEKTDTLSSEQFSEFSWAILGLYLISGKTALNLKNHSEALPFSEIQIESGIDELRNKGIIVAHTSHGEYRLTPFGKKLLADKMSKSK
jgi:hypothetical protein